MLAQQQCRFAAPSLVLHHNHGARWWTPLRLQQLNSASSTSKVRCNAASAAPEVLVATIESAASPAATAAAGVSSSSRLSDQYMFLLAVMASVIMGTLSCIFVAAIPTLLAIRKAAESMDKLASAAREELPGTMAAIRLSGMEISDLTMELSDLGHEITAGVRRSTRTVRAAEDGLRRVTNFTSSALRQVPTRRRMEPEVARNARALRQMIVRSRTLVKSLVTLSRLSAWFRNWHRK